MPRRDHQVRDFICNRCKSALLLCSVVGFTHKETVTLISSLCFQISSRRNLILRNIGLLSPLRTFRSPSSRLTMAPPAVCLQGKHTTVPEVCQIRCQFPTDPFLKSFYSFCLITPVTKSESLQSCRTQTTTESVPHSRTLLCFPVMCTFRGHHLPCQWRPRPAARKVDPSGAR